MVCPRKHYQDAIRERAQDRCEYCLISQDLQGAQYHIEHILPQSKGGKTQIDNLALACPSCNLYKSNHTEAIDPITQQLIKLFNPRTDLWEAHLKLDWNKIVGLTDIGRTTIELLRLNSDRKLQIRELERLIGLSPK